MAIKNLIPIAKKAGIISLDYWGKKTRVWKNENGESETYVNSEVDNFLKKEIALLWPEYGIQTRGGEQINNDSDYQWLVALNGTKNFVGQNPNVQVQVALMFREETVLGLIYNPISEQLFYALKGKGAYLDGKKIVLRESPLMGDAIIDIDTGNLQNLNDSNPVNKNWIKEKIIELIGESKRIRMSGGMTSIYLVTGAINAYVVFNTGIKPYHLATRIIIMEEAGYSARIVKLSNEKMAVIVAGEPLLSEIEKIILQ